MTSSRRDFLTCCAGIATSVSPWRADVFASHKPEPLGLDEQNALIRLDSNENAYGPSSKVLDAIRSATASSNRYSRLKYQDLVQHIAASHQTVADRVLLGCGSTEILRMVACAYLGEGKQLLHASPTFEAIEHYARAVNSAVLTVALTRSFAHDLERMLSAITSSTSLVYICNPNNPTASLTPREELQSFIAKIPQSILVVIDEAYHHYAGKSAMYSSFMDYAVQDDRVLITRTFSTVYGLAGLRLGYAVASPKVLQRMSVFRTEDSINAIVTQAAFAALNDAEGLGRSIEQNANDRQEFFNEAMARSLTPIDSHANFVMMDTFHTADEVIEHFRKNNILIGRCFPPMNTYIRVSLGLRAEMQEFWRIWDLLPYVKNGMHH